MIFPSLSDWKKVKRRRIFCDMGKWHEMKIPMSINKCYLNTAIVKHVPSVAAVTVEAELRRYGQKSLKSWLLGPLQKKLACPWSGRSGPSLVPHTPSSPAYVPSHVWDRQCQICKPGNSFCRHCLWGCYILVWDWKSSSDTFGSFGI